VLTPREIKRRNEGIGWNKSTKYNRDRGARNLSRLWTRRSSGHNGINPRVAINSDTASVAVVRHVASPRASLYLKLCPHYRLKPRAELI